MNSHRRLTLAAVVSVAGLFSSGVHGVDAASPGPIAAFDARVAYDGPAAFNVAASFDVAASDAPPILVAAPGGATGDANLDRQADILFWQSVARADTRDLYEGYLRKFGDAGQFAIIAHQRIKDLSGGAAPAAATAVAPGPSSSSACDRLAMSPTAQARPADVLGVDEPDPTVAVPACEAAVRDSPGNGRLEYDLGRAYSASRKYADAGRLWEQAARDGNNDAYYALGAAAYKGEGAPQDYARAFDLFTKAADADVPNGMVGLGSMYDRGLFVRKDFALARSFYEKAVALGSPGGLRNLGFLYYNGSGVKKDIGLARDYLERAARQKDAMAIKFLADLAAQPNRVQTARVAAHGHATRCPLGSTGSNTAWLVRGMPLNNFHTNGQGQIVAGAPTHCN